MNEITRVDPVARAKQGISLSLSRSRSLSFLRTEQSPLLEILSIRMFLDKVSFSFQCRPCPSYSLSRILVPTFF